jgi:hypothetical protein
MRKVLIALAAVAALVILMPMEASARQGVGGGGGRGGGWHGGGGGGGMRGLSAGRSFGRASFGGMRGFRTAGFRGFRAARLNGGYFRRAHMGGLGRHGGRFARRTGFLTAAPLLYAPYSYYFSDFGYDLGYFDGCYEPQPLLTPRGVIWQRTWVCY